METVANRVTISGQLGSFRQYLTHQAEKYIGCFWFLLCLMLFIVLGPFSAPVVLITLARLAGEADLKPEPESI